MFLRESGAQQGLAEREAKGSMGAPLCQAEQVTCSLDSDLTMTKANIHGGGILDTSLSLHGTQVSPIEKELP